MTEKTDILIRTTKDSIKKEFEKPYIQYHFCSVLGIIKENRYIFTASKIMFSDGKDVFAEGMVDHLIFEDNGDIKVAYMLLKEVSYPEPSADDINQRVKLKTKAKPKR